MSNCVVTKCFVLADIGKGVMEWNVIGSRGGLECKIIAFLITEGEMLQAG
jgi:hypothetical protein